MIEILWLCLLGLGLELDIVGSLVLNSYLLLVAFLGELVKEFVPWS